MSPRRWTRGLVGLVFLSVAPALGQGTDAPPAESRATERRSPKEARAQRAPVRHFSLTMSPIHLALPMFEVQGEVLVVRHFGVAAILGVGSITAESTDPEIDGEQLSAYEAGLQLVGYPLRPFSWLQLGAEVLWLQVEGEDLTSQNLSGSGSGTAIGPFVGFKGVTRGGFTGFAQVGFQSVVAHAEASDDAGNTDSASESGIIPLLNLNLGWSF